EHRHPRRARDRGPAAGPRPGRAPAAPVRAGGGLPRRDRPRRRAVRPHRFQHRRRARLRRRPRHAGRLPGHSRRPGAPQGHRPAGDVPGHHRVRHRDDPADLAGLDGAGQGPGPVRRRFLHHVDVPRRRRGRRCVPRHHRHAGDHGAGHCHRGADRPDDRHLPGGVRQRPAQARHHLLRRRHDRDPVDRGGPVRVRALHADLRQRRAARRHGGRGPRGADDPGRRPILRGGPQAGPERVPGGQLRARRAEVAHGGQGRPADGDGGAGHRRHAVGRPGRRRDRSAADHRRPDHRHQPQPVRRSHGDAAGVRLLPAHPTGDRHAGFHRPGLDGSPPAHHPGHGAQRRRPPDQPLLRPQDRSL
ncbi:MAG: Phosphate transport system permease protein PstA, partial [uncultured Blastococcus sp.]